MPLRGARGYRMGLEPVLYCNFKGTPRHRTQPLGLLTPPGSRITSGPSEARTPERQFHPSLARAGALIKLQCLSAGSDGENTYLPPRVLGRLHSCMTGTNFALANVAQTSVDFSDVSRAELDVLCTAAHRGELLATSAAENQLHAGALTLHLSPSPRR